MPRGYFHYCNEAIHRRRPSVLVAKRLGVPAGLSAMVLRGLCVESLEWILATYRSALPRRNGAIGHDQRCIKQQRALVCEQCTRTHDKQGKKTDYALDMNRSRNIYDVIDSPTSQRSEASLLTAISTMNHRQFVNSAKKSLALTTIDSGSESKRQTTSP